MELANIQTQMAKHFKVDGFMVKERDKEWSPIRTRNIIMTGKMDQLHLKRRKWQYDFYKGLYLYQKPQIAG